LTLPLSLLITPALRLPASSGPPSPVSLQTKTEADQAEIKRLYGQFGKWHGISSVNNLAVLVATFAYGWSLAGKLAL
jgi:hypothetical protein